MAPLPRQTKRASIARRDHREPPSFHQSIYDDGSVLIVTLIGELDTATVPQVEGALDRHGDDYRGVIINLARVTFVASCAIQTLVALQAKYGDGLAIVPPGDGAAEIFDLTGLRKHFRWIQSPADELRRLASRDT